MQNIDQLRSEIDQIHTQLGTLFKRRLVLTQKIWKIKKAQGLALIDQTREEQIIHQFDQSTSDLLEQKALQGFFKSLLVESKRFLEGQNLK